MITVAVIFWILMGVSLWRNLAVWYAGEKNKVSPATLSFLLLWVPVAMIGWQVFKAPITFG